MSVSFDFTLSNASEHDVEAVARTIFLMTDHEIFQNDEYFTVKAGLAELMSQFPSNKHATCGLLSWDLLIQESLIFLMKYEAKNSDMEARPPSLSNVLGLLCQGQDALESVLINLEIWNLVPDHLKVGCRTELELRLGAICAISDLPDLVPRTCYLSPSNEK
jgi:hypothetical protein